MGKWRRKTQAGRTSQNSKPGPMPSWSMAEVCEAKKEPHPQALECVSGVRGAWEDCTASSALRARLRSGRAVRTLGLGCGLRGPQATAWAGEEGEARTPRLVCGFHELWFGWAAAAGSPSLSPAPSSLPSFAGLSPLGPSRCPWPIFTVFCVSPPLPSPSLAVFSLSCTLEGPEAERRSR